MESSRKLVVRVFVGGYSNHQESCFNQAWATSSLFKEGATKEVLYHDNVRMKRWGFVEIIEWLKESDIHFILCHMHQGRKQQQWDCTQLYLNLMDLQYHLGFPMAESLCCPIFTQNKLNYLSAVTHINFTLAIELQSLQLYTDHQKRLIFPSDSVVFQWSDCNQIINELTRYTRRCKESDMVKWVLKFPFRTNCDNMKWCEDYPTLTKRIIECNDAADIGESVPYGLIQPHLHNGKEYKVILLDGEAEFYSVKNSGNKSVAFADKDTLFRFAEQSLRTLKIMRPGTISEGVVRVDIMQRNDGVMIVNEFEGFEARFEKTDKTDEKVRACLTKFWANKLQHVYECTKYC